MTCRRQTPINKFPKADETSGEETRDVEVWCTNDYLNMSQHPEVVNETVKTLLEIGTGSGLLSIMAANLGAHEINTCETNSIMATTARQVIADNNLSEKINVIQKKSNNIKIGEDMNKQADVLVSEIFSSELSAHDSPKVGVS